QCDLRAHFGLGKTATIDRIEVSWPGAKKPTVYKKVKADQIIEIREGSKKYRKID
ncbi:ASPIC/UnbV domain-containing protein, partial [Acidobacteriota bacterium]